MNLPSDNRAWCIYALLDPITRTVRYVGFTTQTPEQRLRKHILRSTARRRLHRERWIASLVDAGTLPLLEILEIGVGPSWSDAERRWILHFRSLGCSLTNHTDGGEGCLNRGTSEYRKAIRQKGINSTTAEQRSEAARKGFANRTLEQRSSGGKAAALVISLEKRRQMGRDGMNKRLQNMTAEQKSQMMQRAREYVTTEGRSSGAKKMWARRSPEERSSIRKLASKMTFEQRSRAATTKALNQSPFLTVGDTTLRIIQWIKAIGISRGTFNLRLRNGWTLAEAVYTPTVKRSTYSKAKKAKRYSSPLSDWRPND